MHNDIKKILVSEEKLIQKVKELGQKITEDYSGKDLLLICVLKGAAIFVSDLMKRMISWPFLVMALIQNHLVL